MMNAVMVNLDSAPLNAYTWTWGAIAVYAFTIRSYISYRRTKNPLAKIYTFVGLSFAMGLLFYGFPGLFTQSPHILNVTYFMADLFVQIALQFAVWLLWFIGLRVYLNLKYLLAITIPLSTVIMVLHVMTSQVSLSLSQNLIIYTDKFPVLLLKSIIYILVPLPLAFFLIKQVPNQSSARAKFQSLIAGAIFIAVMAASVSNNIFDKGSDTRGSCLSLAVFFTIFFLAQLPRPKLGH